MLSTSRTVAALLCSCALARSANAEGPFRYAEDRAPSTLNPAFVSSMVDIRLEELLFEGLYTYNEELRSEPALVEKCTVEGPGTCEETPSRSVNIKLKKATWHDGRPVTAGDVEFTVKLLQDKKTGSPAAPSVKCIEKVVSKGLLELTITFTRVEPEPSRCLMFKVLPQHRFSTFPVLRSHDFRTRPTGSGPYKLVRWEGTTMELEADPTHNVGLKSLQAKFINKKEVQLDFLTYDSLEAIVRIRPNDRSVIEGMGEKVELVPYASQTWWYIGINHKNPHLARRDVREAIAHAIDTEELRKTFLGEGFKISGPFAPGSQFYNETVPPYDLDLTATAALMKAAGYQRSGNKGPYSRGGTPIKLRMVIDRGLSHYKDVAITLENKLKQAGFGTSLEWIETSAWTETVVEKREFDLTIGIWSFDDSSDIYPLFHTNGTENYFSYSNPSMDALLDESRKTQNPELYQSIYREAHKLARNDLPYVFLWSVKGYAAVSTRVSGIEIHPFRFFTWIEKWKWRE